MGMRLDPETTRKVLEAAALPTAPLSEKAFQSMVLSFARHHGWLAYHTHDSRKSAAGFLDCVFVRERVVWAELKSEDGRLTPDQETWIEALQAAGCEVYLWRPSDWPAIERVLTEVVR